MEMAKLYRTLASPSMKLDLDESGKKVEITLYKGMIGSLFYFTTSRHDIIFNI